MYLVFRLLLEKKKEADEDHITFSTKHNTDIYTAKNDKGRIDTVFRKFKLSARAAIQQFGEVSANIATTAKKDPYEEVEILHAVYPRADFNPKKQDKSNMPFESVYLEAGSGDELSASGKGGREGGGREGSKRGREG